MGYRWWSGKKQALGKTRKMCPDRCPGRWAQARGKKIGRGRGKLNLGNLTTLSSFRVRCPSSVIPTHRVFSINISTLCPFCLIFFLPSPTPCLSPPSFLPQTPLAQHPLLAPPLSVLAPCLVNSGHMYPISWHSSSLWLYN